MKAYLTAALLAASFIGGLAHADVLDKDGNELPPGPFFSQRHETGSVTRAQVKAELARAVAAGELDHTQDELPGPSGVYPQSAAQAHYASVPASTRNN